MKYFTISRKQKTRSNYLKIVRSKAICIFEKNYSAVYLKLITKETNKMLRNSIKFVFIVHGIFVAVNAMRNIRVF